MTFSGVGLDSAQSDSPRERFFTFATSASGPITASVRNTSASVRLCLGRGEPGSISDEACQTGQNAVVRADDAASATWTVTLTGTEGVDVPVTDLALTFASSEPEVTVAGFRFQGTAFAEYNGLAASVSAAAGLLELSAAWRGGSQPYRITIQDDGQEVDSASGQGEGVEFETRLPGASTYRIELRNDIEFATTDVKLSAKLSWP